MKEFLPAYRDLIEGVSSEGLDVSDCEAEFQNIRNAIVAIEWNGCIRERINEENCIRDELQKKCGFCILTEKGII